MAFPINRVICGDCVEEMQKFPPDSVDLVVTSPPYWGLRFYGEETVRVWGGLPECEHEWGTEVSKGGRIKRPQDFDPKYAKGLRSEETNPFLDKPSNFCINCGAWRGSLGLEPHPQLFIDHLVEIFREVKRVLKPSGTFWLNLGDTYYGSGGAGGDYNPGGLREGQPKYKQSSKTRSRWLQPKQLLGVPWRVAIALQHDGWVLRNAIIWHKPNHMPSSVKDRLTKSYEHVFLFAKKRKYYFDLDAIRVPHKSEDYHKKGKNPGDMWSISTKPFKGAHFAVFPLALIEPIIEAGCPAGGIVLDPFCGSGTACVVAKKFRRRWIGIEIKPEYVEMAKERIDAQSVLPVPIDHFMEEK